MRRAIRLATLLGGLAMGLGLLGTAYADSFSLGVQTNNVNLGIHIGPTPPPLVAVPAPVVVAPGLPGPPPPAVYTAPNLPYNYFVYQNRYYLYREGYWFRARHYNGPWTVISIAQVPRPVLAVPVEQYRERPAHWKKHGPPPWAHEREQERHGHQEHGQGHGHDKGRD
jgi:WXXGXW repeat (2 copies)